ncbi:FAD binding domain-containing protein [Amycolatopsis australiensis]|uniref:Xanthine dehydrogenase YagS FAD-binding subunit n=1 Tax=Amycolatopsis australiensis TaxID=546364 RepID=A0A1K1REQ1_9PSEU|nr:xanthine dehydrogenase family protein subunit M [Amycolatopsis australiensis]SFW70283.1 xanthine dehydrogenase YagS FAD-binding subunit [Amycolatopsis australiensis]
MKPFTYARPATAAEAVDAVAGDPAAAFLGGGTNLVDHLKLGVAAPGRIVDVTALSSREITEDPGGGLVIGAGVPNSDLAADRRVRERYPVLAQALLSGASAQLRNRATTGGNPLQRTRCLYFQDVTTPCNKRSPGTGCSAIGGATRQHAILGASEHCVATHPSDLAVALAALDAGVRVLGPAGEREIPVAGLHRLPGDRPDRDTVLEHGDLITAITVPARPWARRSAYRKVRDRASYAFALVSVAAAVDVRDGELADVRIALGGVAHKPWRAHRAEDVLRGGRPGDALFRAAAEAELADARPLDGVDGGNAFKIPLVARTLNAVLRDLTAEEPRR